MTTETARRLPIRTIFSGPAGGVSQACHVGAVTGTRNFITYDMGGTSTDVCLVRDLTPVMTSDSMVGAFPVKVPQIDMHTVGAGGGSIAWLDVDGSLQVGPRSAGASPGPGGYGLGGTEPTVTDANVVLGRIAGSRRLGGSITLDPGKARAAVAALAGRIDGLDVEALAEGIVKIAVARMTSAIREISIQRGHDPRDFTLIAFGGAGPDARRRAGGRNRHHARPRPAPSRELLRARPARLRHQARRRAHARGPARASGRRSSRRCSPRWKRRRGASSSWRASVPRRGACTARSTCAIAARPSS